MDCLNTREHGISERADEVDGGVDGLGRILLADGGLKIERPQNI
jgi:hypothetical protein